MADNEPRSFKISEKGFPKEEGYVDITVRLVHFHVKGAGKKFNGFYNPFLLNFPEIILRMNDDTTWNDLVRQVQVAQTEWVKTFGISCEEKTKDPELELKLQRLCEKEFADDIRNGNVEWVHGDIFKNPPDTERFKIQSRENPEEILGEEFVDAEGRFLVYMVRTRCSKLLGHVAKMVYDDKNLDPQAKSATWENHVILKLVKVIASKQKQFNRKGRLK